ncbi:MAG: exosortase/archaeosortase family protein [Acidobacteriia bacterium]|nr:exosortase/archaeosortase family protein [Terriglobia bacterium]
MTPAVEKPRTFAWPWTKFAWLGLLIAACYGPVLKALVRAWDDPDMGHGYFVPLAAGFIIWQQREELRAIKPRPNWWGLVVVILGGIQLIVSTLGVELFLARTAFVVTLIGVVWFLGGDLMLKKLAFPLFLLFFMVPIPTIVYTLITFKLQILASQLADAALSVIDIPVFREGNILELPNQRLSVVEACSGIRSLLTLTFLTLIYGYFFEKRTWLRVVLFVATIPIAIVANASRVTMTGIMTQVKPEYAEGFFHESTGIVIFFVALFLLVLFHQGITRLLKFRSARRFRRESPG